VNASFSLRFACNANPLAAPIWFAFSAFARQSIPFHRVYTEFTVVLPCDPSHWQVEGKFGKMNPIDQAYAGN
jgi:hypothetical protein